MDDDDVLETDYLVIGTGAVAMAFVDTLLDECDADIVMVDRHHRPGGHWNDAYSFVRLHHPAVYYGVASRPLGSPHKDVSGRNAGLDELCSGAEVLVYFDDLMRQRFLPSGRVRWFPMCEVETSRDGTHRFRSLTTGRQRVVTVRRKVVDGTHTRTQVPATHPPSYAVAPGVTCVPPNRLPKIGRPYRAYTVVGSGKTGMDACLWLLDHGVPAARIRWIMPRDAWLLDRANFQADDIERTMGSNLAQLDAVVQATSVADLFERLEARGMIMRIDPAIEPTAYRCANVSQGELAELRSIRDIVRRGHVRGIEPGRITLDQGAVDADPDTLYVDCTADALHNAQPGPVYDGKRINLLMLRACQPVFSAALIARIECRLADEAEKNRICTPVLPPREPLDWLRLLSTTLANGALCRQHREIGDWIDACRLNYVTVWLRGSPADPATKTAMLKRAGATARAAAAKLPLLLADAAAPS
ncbi:MAG TPA: hypothetical protein VHM00_16830 [Caldimonas sp.]|jgi:hypothetical protein|nr:hypothetical protein [Caldimonas sp.]HEX2542737.1 hypothetical protein [Caldimonas sp.]